jgi:hypothetical protein
MYPAARSFVPTFGLILAIAFALIAPTISAKDHISGSIENRSENSVLGWNTGNNRLPLLNLPEQMNFDLDTAFAFPLGQYRLPLFQSLYYNAKFKRYMLLLTSNGSRKVEFVQLDQAGSSRNYTSTNEPAIRLVDEGKIKTLHAVDGAEYRFAQVPGGELRCVRIQNLAGVEINLTYRADGLAEMLVDRKGRSIRFNYSGDHIDSVTQTWPVDTVNVTRTWTVGAVIETARPRKVSYAHASGFGRAKAVPTNAITPNYSVEMASCDRMLAGIFGGPGAVGAANGFEPVGLANQYPIYRGDIRGSDGAVHRGHLSYAMHLYGSVDGTGETPLYVPAGFTSHSATPTPTDAAVTFFYPRLGNLENVTLAVFHIANFQISNEGDRVRIGNIGGPGGSYSFYKHSHIEFYRGNTGLPSSKAREALRINPAAVFGSPVVATRLRAAG